MFFSRFKRRHEPISALTFDDISLMPKNVSSIPTRKDERISMGMQISKNIKLNIPVVASYMDTVCEAPMAIEMARLGGLGIIHRWMSIEDQVSEVEAVKRAENKIIKDPYTIYPETTLGDIKREFLEKEVGAFLVVSEDNKLLGIVSTRDVDLREGNSLTAKDIMTPREKLITGNPNITEHEAVGLFMHHKKEKIPLVDDNNNLCGMVSKKDLKKLQNTLASRDKDGHLLVGASIGLGNDMLKRTQALIDAGADMIVLAIANGYLQSAVDAVEKLRSTWPDIDLAVGCTTEYEGTKRLFKAGADTVLVGIGPGSVCETRVVAGVGIPQFTALRLAQKAAREEGKFIISDGGVSQPHHLNKAMFAGASAVILGSVLAGTDKAPGDVINVNNRLVKFQRGLASDNAKQKLDEINAKAKELNRDDLMEYVYYHVEAEGVESGFVSYSGTTVDAVRRIIGGLRSSMTYMGATDIQEFWEQCNMGNYVRITDTGSKEGMPHSLDDFVS